MIECDDFFLKGDDVSVCALCVCVCVCVLCVCVLLTFSLSGLNDELKSFVSAFLQESHSSSSSSSSFSSSSLDAE